MNNQIDVNKLDPLEKLQEKVNENAYLASKKHLSFLKR